MCVCVIGSDYLEVEQGPGSKSYGPVSFTQWMDPQEMPSADLIREEAKNKTSSNPQAFDGLFITNLCSIHFVKPLVRDTDHES